MKNIWDKPIKIIVVLFSFSIISCASIKKYGIEKKEQSTEHLFKQWHTETQQILERNKAKGELQKSINEILTLYLSKDEKTDSKRLFPKLEYQILEETIKVSIYKKLGQTPDEQDLIFSEIDFKHSLNYDNSGKKILIFTPRYQKILQKKLPYGFTDQTEKKNKNARAVLIKIGEGYEYEIPAPIHILFDKNLNSAIIYRYRKGSFGKPFWFRYSKQNKQWKYDKIKFNIRIP